MAAPLTPQEPGATHHLPATVFLNPDAEATPPAMAPTIAAPQMAPEIQPPLAAGAASPQVTASTPSPTHPVAPSTQTRDAVVEQGIRFFDSPVAKLLVARFSAIFAVMLVIEGALSYLLRHGPAESLPLLVTEIVGALLLPILRVVPWAEEDNSDLVLFILLNLMFGPLVALMAYGLFSLVRQDVNPGIMGCLIVASLSYGVYMAIQDSLSLTATMPFGQLNHQLGLKLVQQLLLDWSGLLTLVGWYVASTFRKLNE
jgi:hypothetical protein